MSMFASCLLYLPISLSVVPNLAWSFPQRQNLPLSADSLKNTLRQVKICRRVRSPGRSKELLFVPLCVGSSDRFWSVWQQYDPRRHNLFVYVFGDPVSAFQKSASLLSPFGVSIVDTFCHCLLVFVLGLAVMLLCSALSVDVASQV